MRLPVQDSAVATVTPRSRKSAWSEDTNSATGSAATATSGRTRRNAPGTARIDPDTLRPVPVDRPVGDTVHGQEDVARSARVEADVVLGAHGHRPAVFLHRARAVVCDLVVEVRKGRPAALDLNQDVE